MISVEEALTRILSYVDVLPPEDKPLVEALGQVLDEDITAGFNIPPLDNTAMDGYAVRAADTAGAAPTSPVNLRVIGEVAAGYEYSGEVAPGTAVRIMTGAPVPNGADASCHSKRPTSRSTRHPNTHGGSMEPASGSSRKPGWGEHPTVGRRYSAG